MRTVELTGEISLKKAVVVTAKLRKFHEKDSCAPICLQINSTGGETGSAALIITCMKDLGRDLHIITHGCGQISSAAVSVFVQGYRRLIEYDAVMLFHRTHVDEDYRSFTTLNTHEAARLARAYAKLSIDLKKADLEDVKNTLRKRPGHLYASTITPRELLQMIDDAPTASDLILDGNQVYEYGLADHLLKDSTEALAIIENLPIKRRRRRR